MLSHNLYKVVYEIKELVGLAVVWPFRVRVGSQPLFVRKPTPIMSGWNQNCGQRLNGLAGSALALISFLAEGRS